MTEISIVCGVDGSSCSVRAATVAATLAAELRARVVLVHVLPPRPPMPLAAVPLGAHPVTSTDMQELDHRESEAAFAAAEPELEGLPVDRVVEKGNPPTQIAAVAVEQDATLIVVGTRSRGRATTALLGSVAHDLAGEAPRPVVVVPQTEQQALPGRLAPGPIVCGVDGSDGARRAVHVASELAQKLQTALAVVSVTSEQSDEDGALALAVAGGEAWRHGIEIVARSGDAATELAQAARERQAPLLVLGSRGRGSLRAALLGSVSAGAARLAPCPVVIVPPEASIARGDERAASTRP